MFENQMDLKLPPTVFMVRRGPTWSNGLQEDDDDEEDVVWWWRHQVGCINFVTHLGTGWTSWAVLQVCFKMGCYSQKHLMDCPHWMFARPRLFSTFSTGTVVSTRVTPLETTPSSAGPSRWGLCKGGLTRMNRELRDVDVFHPPGRW